MNKTTIRKSMRYLTASFITLVLFLIFSPFLSSLAIIHTQSLFPIVFMIMMLFTIAGVLSIPCFYVFLARQARYLQRSWVLWVGLTFISMPLGPFVAYFMMRHFVRKALATN